MTEANLSAEQAKDHLAMVDRILARADDPIRVSGWPFIIWGLFGAAANFIGMQPAFDSQVTAHPWAAVEILGPAVVLFLVMRFVQSRQSRERVGLVDRHVSSLLMISWGVALVITVFGTHVFTGWAQSAIWTLIYGIGLMSVAALIRSRTMFVGGMVLIASIVVASHLLSFAGWALGAGWLIGFCGMGLVLLVERR